MANETIQDDDTSSPSTGSQEGKNYETDNSIAFSSEEKPKVSGVRDTTTGPGVLPGASWRTVMSAFIFLGVI